MSTEQMNHLVQEGGGVDEEPVMERLLYVINPIIAARIQVQQLERLLQEIEITFQRCSIAPNEFIRGHDLSEEGWELEQRKQEKAILLVRRADDILEEHRSDDGALVSYFRRSICNPRNLETMLTIMDPDTRTDNVRSNTFCILDHLMFRSNYGVWNAKLSNGQRFATDFLFQCAKSLERHADDDDGMFQCRDIACTMENCLRLTKEAPIDILDRIFPFDWSVIFESQRATPGLYVEIAKLVLSVSNSDMRKPEIKAMLESLGRCFGLLRRTLRQILVLRSLKETSSPEDMSEAINSCMYELDEFWSLFYKCMSGPPPREIERELDVIFGCVHSTLKEARPHVLRHLQLSPSDLMSTSWLTVKDYDTHINETEVGKWWNKAKTLTPSERRRLRKQYISKHLSTTDLKQSRKACKRSQRKLLSGGGRVLEARIENLCVNCFKTPRDLDLADELFQMCTLCKQVAYCSHKCQRQHWKRIHRSNCTGNTGQVEGDDLEEID